MESLLLVYPPLAKNCEPPPGVARLAGVLRGRGVSCSVLDLNRLAFAFVFELESSRRDTWSLRARKNLTTNVGALQSLQTYGQIDRYKRAVADVNRVLTGVGGQRNLELSLANYQDACSPVRSDDLLKVAKECQSSLFYPLFEAELIPLIEQSQPDYIGISLTYLSQASPCFALIGFLRRRYPQIKIILGGGLVTSWMRSPHWNNPFSGLVDDCLAGPGESFLLGLLGAGQTEARGAPPAYDQMDYFSPGFILPYAASSGCYWNKCLFCPETAEETPYLPLAPSQVIAELGLLVKKHQPLLVHFLDNAVSPALMRELTETALGVPWYGFARACPLLADETFCQHLRRSGCVMLKLGLESGDQRVLDGMEKGIDLLLVERVLRALAGAGIMTYVYLLFGTPAEDEASARRTMDFTIQHRDEIDFLNLAIFNLPVGGPEAKNLELNAFSGGDLSLYTDFNHPKGWSRRQVRRFLNKEFKRHPAIATILQADPPLFTSNHAPLFHPHFRTRPR